MFASVTSTKNTAFLPAAGLVNGRLGKLLVECVLCLRAFHTAENECPPICQIAKIVSTKLLLQTLYGTTLNIVFFARVCMVWSMFYHVIILLINELSILTMLLYWSAQIILSISHLVMTHQAIIFCTLICINIFAVCAALLLKSYNKYMFSTLTQKRSLKELGAGALFG